MMSNSHTLPRVAALAAGLLLGASAHAALPSGVSGAWYNPSQPGHGLSIKVVAPDRALVFWYAYDLEGNPFNLYIDGRIQGQRIEAIAAAPRGMRFGSFDPAELVTPTWGEVTIEIDDCIKGRLSWNAIDPAYGSGSIEIARLAGIDDLTCEFGKPGPLAEGLYAADVKTRFLGVGAPYIGPGIAAVDPDGTLWGIELLQDGFFGAVPGPTSFVTDRQIMQTTFRQPSASDTGIVVQATLNTWARDPLGALGPVQGNWQATAGGELRYRDSRQPDVSWTFRPSEAVLVKPLAMELLEGTYSLSLDGQLAPTQAEVEFGADAGLCLRYLNISPEDLCQFSGRYWLVDGADGFLEFELRALGARRADESVYRGRGWLQKDAEGEAVVLVGDDGYSGLGLIARK